MFHCILENFERHTFQPFGYSMKLDGIHDGSPTAEIAVATSKVSQQSASPLYSTDKTRKNKLSVFKASHRPRKKQTYKTKQAITKKPLVDLRQFEPFIAFPVQRTLRFPLCTWNYDLGLINSRQNSDEGLLFSSDSNSETLDLFLSPDYPSMIRSTCKQQHERLLEMKYTIMSVRVRFGMDIWALAAQIVNPFEIVPCVAGPVLNRAFFKMWELLKNFDLVPPVGANPRFVSVHLCEGPGGFIQAIQRYRDNSAVKNSLEDSCFGNSCQQTTSADQAIQNRLEGIHGIHSGSLHTESFTSQPREDICFALTLARDARGVDNVLSKGKGFSERIPPPQLDIRKLEQGAFGYLKGHVHYGADQSGDITNPANISSFVDYVLKCNRGRKIGLVTADGALDASDDFSVQEQSHLQLTFCEICTAVKLQAKGGTLVLKIFDCFSEASTTLLVILSSMYKQLEVVRLRTSRVCNSERYIIAKEFQELAPSLEERLMALASGWYKASQNGENVGIRILNTPSSEFFGSLLSSNAVIAETQHEAITKAVHVATVLGDLLPNILERRKGLVSMLRRKIRVLNTMQQNAFALCNDLNIPLHNDHSFA
eukprot:Gb_18426 [translate_table: standard]